MRIHVPAVVVSLLLSMSGPASANDAIVVTKRPTAIPAQGLAPALETLAQERKLYLIFASQDLGSLRTPGAWGDLTPGEALKQLLNGTGLTFRFIDEKTVSILPQAPAAQTTVTGAAMSSVPLRLARAEAPPSSESSDDAARPAAAAADTDAGGKGIPEILVKGARTGNTDIRRTEDDVQPYVVFEAQEIKRAMAGTLEEFLKQRLPMNTSSSSEVQKSFTAFGDHSSINLRGLGDDETLILVNGRRMPGFSFGSSAPGQADLNGIPLSAVERIEVLPSTAGGIYGGGATGGVVNIILRNDYRGLEVNAQYQNAFDTDVAARHYSISGGYELGGGRTRVNLSLNDNSANSMTIGDRDFLRRARALVLENNPAALLGSTSPPAGATSNIRSLSGQPLVLKDGNRPLGHAITYVPYGYAGPASDGGAALLANAGQYNLDIPQGLAGLQRSLMTTPRRQAATLNIHHLVTDRFEVFADGTYSETESVSHLSRFSTNAITLQPSAPNNPFTAAIRVQFPASDFDYGARQEHQNSTLSLGVGAILRLPRNWSAQGEFAFGRSTRETTSNSLVTQTTVNTALANGTVDIMRDVNVFPLDYSDYYYTPLPNNYYLDPFATETRNYSLRMAGPALQLPAGQLMVSGLLERRETLMKPSMNVVVRDPIAYNYTPEREQNTDSYYMEATVPLFSASNGFAGMHGLDLQASYRNDRTATRTVANFAAGIVRLNSPDEQIPEVPYNKATVKAHQYTLGLRYRPVQSLTLRASYGRGVLPPSMSQLVPIEFANFMPFGAIDPKRKNEPVGRLERYSFLGYPGLQAEESGSWSAGIVIQPVALRGLRVSVDYTLIDKTDEIAFITDRQFLELEDFLPGRIVRNPLTDQDRLDGYEAGTIREMYSGSVNFAKTKAEAYDLQVDYTWESSYGTFHANLLTTFQQHLLQQAQAGAPTNDLVGHSGGVLKWRGNAGLSWEHSAWAAGWNMQYYDDYLVYSATANPSLRASSMANQGSDTIPSQLYHDLFVQYRFGGEVNHMHGLLRNCELSIGIANVLDTSPPIIASTSATDSGYSTFGDARLRRYSISIAKSFR